MKMKRNKGKIIIILIILVVLIIGGYFVYQKVIQKKKESFTEYTPQEEISEEQLRQTIVTLYYKNKESGELMPEARKVDVNLLAKNPYDALINLLIEGPKSDKCVKLIPEGAILNKTELKGDILYVDFSKEFVENHPVGKEEEKKTINSVADTLMELTEVNAVRILIDGEENKEFKDKEINFTENFTGNNL